MSQGIVSATSRAASVKSKFGFYSAHAAVVALAMGLAASWAPAETITWVGGSGSSWSVAANWSPADRVPGTGGITNDVVIIPAQATPSTININSGTYTIAQLTCAKNLLIANSGTRLTISGTETSVVDGNFTLQSSAALDGTATVVLNGLVTWSSSASMRGGGTTIFGPNAVLDIKFGVNLDNRVVENQSTAPASSVIGSMFINNNSTFRNAAGAVFTVGNSTTGSSSFSQSSGTNAFINEGEVFKSSTQTWTISVPFTNSGTLTVAEGTVDLSGAFANLANGTLTGGIYQVAGVLKVGATDITTLAADVTLNGASAAIRRRDTLADALGKLASVAADGRLALENQVALVTTTAVTNAGTVVIGDASFVGGAGANLTVGGAYTQTAGSTTLDGGVLEAAGGVDIQAGTLNGNGGITGNVINGGTVAPGLSPGVLAITGDYTQLSGGALAIELGGLTVGTEFDQLQVSGTATLAGSLVAMYVNDFIASVGDEFEILTFGSVSGEFTPEGGDCAAVTMTATSLKLVVGNGYPAPTNVQADPAMILPGGTSTLTATPGEGGVGVEWFADACGGTPLGGGAAPVVQPSVTTTYYVRTTGPAGSCSLNPCASVTVTVGGAIGVPIHVRATPRSICGPGGSTVLSAAPGTGGDTVEWFTDGCGQTPVPGGATPTVTPAETTTYYVRTVDSASGSTGEACASFTVTVSPAMLGDFDSDCDVDADDLAAFNTCVSGPGNQYEPEDPCLSGDFDHDFDVDMDDFSYFQRAYTGTLKAPFDFDADGDVDMDDFGVFASCFSGPSVHRSATGNCALSDRDRDLDVDLADYAAFQRCFSGTDELADLNCAD